MLKPDKSLRPIGVGAARRRITGKAMCAQLAPELATLSHRAGAAQFASQYRGGCEAQVWLIKSKLSLHPWPDWLSLQVDGVNAFNSMDRRIMLEEVELRCPKLYNYAFMFYGRSDSELIIELDKPCPIDMELPEGARLMNADRTHIAITSETGVTQGDALAMILFTICLQRVLGIVAAAFPTVDVSAYADDGRLTGPAFDVIAAFKLMQVEMRKLGLEVKTKDLLAYSQAYGTANCCKRRLSSCQHYTCAAPPWS